MDGEKYVRFNASFRVEGMKTFVRIGELKSIQDKYNNEIKKNKDLQVNIDKKTKECDKLEKEKESLEKKIESNKKIKKDLEDQKNTNAKFVEKIKELEDMVFSLQQKNNMNEIKIHNFEMIFGEFLLVKQEKQY